MDDRPILLLGRGARPHRLGEVLSTLARVRAAESGVAPLPTEAPQRLDDLEELLSLRPPGGLLLLDAGMVPLEDIGFVRRFLERRPGWSLLAVGENAADPRARALLALPRADWLAWPPDLDQLEVLLDALSGAVLTPVAPPPRERPRRRHVEEPLELLPGIDLSALVEERLAGSALSGDGGPRFLFTSEGPVRLDLDRRTAARGIDGLLGLARLCAGGSGEVSAAAEPLSGGNARVRLEFPLGPLTDGDLPGLLEQPFEGEPTLSEAVEEARAGADALRSLGADVELVPHQQGRLSFDVLFQAGVPANGEAARRGPSAEDPFA